MVVPQGAVTSIFAGNTPAIPEISPYGDRPSRKVASISKPKNTKSVPKTAATERQVKPAGAETKKAIVTRLLQRSEGATLAEIMKATGWQRHSCHGAISMLGGKSVAGADGELLYKL